jgi:hypothetical protein
MALTGARDDADIARTVALLVGDADRDRRGGIRIYKAWRSRHDGHHCGGQRRPNNPASSRSAELQWTTLDFDWPANTVDMRRRVPVCEGPGR